jgi:nucleoid-associated protein YgaU
MASNVVGEALAKAQAAIEQAKRDRQAQEQAASAQATKNAQASAAAAWKAHEETIEDALENAGISGVDVQIDSEGRAKLVGTVTSDQERDTAVAMAQQFKVTNLDDQLKVVAAAPTDNSDNPLNGATGPVKYKVKAGESWWGIAQRFYGNGKLWKTLKAKNNNPKMIHPGTEITLPLKNQLS